MNFFKVIEKIKFIEYILSKKTYTLSYIYNVFNRFSKVNKWSLKKVQSA